MEEKNSTDMLEEAIQDGFEKLDRAKDSEEYCDRVKAIKDLYELKNQEYRAQADYSNHQEEIEMRDMELEAKKAQDAIENSFNEKKRKTDLLRTGLTIGATAGLSLLTIIENHQGWIFKPDGFLSKLLNHEK